MDPIKIEVKITQVETYSEISLVLDQASRSDLCELRSFNKNSKLSLGH